MVFISNNQIVERRSPWRLSIIPETFWWVLNQATIFLHTLFSVPATDSYTAKKRRSERDFPSNGWGGGGGGGGNNPGGGGGGPRISSMSQLKANNAACSTSA
eukprot:TRINITY_DN6962_c0_g1_i1.p1 TRINITY_DN6962_c0_g1~~TRINITY_DN6962_c0_g1_i1.p1  ORF type:complete len:102 (-),score=18.61 TRINITY_DN6962_c0_g1_i1:263-568(-)